MSETQNEKQPEDLLTTALRMTASMADQDNVMALMKQGLSLCFKVLACERSLLIAEKADGTREVIHHAGSGGKDDPYSTTALKMVDERKEPLLISDTVGDKVLSTRESINTADIRSVLCSRLDTLQKLFGGRKVYLYCDSRTNRRPFKPEDLEKFKLLSLLMAILENIFLLSCPGDKIIRRIYTQSFPVINCHPGFPLPPEDIRSFTTLISYHLFPAVGPMVKIRAVGIVDRFSVRLVIIIHPPGLIRKAKDAGIYASV